MRTTRQRTRFKQDFKRESRGMYRKLLMRGSELGQVVNMLRSDIPLPPKYRDHPLHNNLEGKRKCHLRPDFLLLYSLEGQDFRVLEGLGSHSHLMDL